MTKAAKLSKENQEFLDSLKQPKKEPAADRVIINQISIRKGSFADNETDYGKKLSLIPVEFYTKFMRRGAKKDNYRPAGETVMVKRKAKAEYFDTLGTKMLGRIPAKAIPSSWSDDQKEANKAKGEFYGVLFALNTLDNSLVRIQVPSAKAMAVSQFLDTLQTDQLFTTRITLGLNKDDRLTTAVDDVNLDATNEVVEAIKTVQKYVEQQNAYVMSRYNYLNKKGSDVPEAEEVELDDQIPF